MAPDNYLFNKQDWHAVESAHREALIREIDEYDSERLLNTSPSDLASYFEEKFWIEPVVLRENEIAADQREVQVDVRRDPFRDIRDRSKPFKVKGTRIEIDVPFDGEPKLFRIQPTIYTLNPPQGEVNNGILRLKLEGTNLNPEEVKVQIDRTLTTIRGYLQTLANDVGKLNRQLRFLAEKAISHRRDKLLADRNLGASLGFPLRERPDSSRTYTAPEVRRKLVPAPPPARSDAFEPEPSLADADYEHILGVLQNMAHVMERSPKAFETMDEEALRTHFLVQLNGHYEGQATGETFNWGGKTDILIRSKGKNIFIAECKYWGGPKKLIDTIDQILDYTSWRDTKTAVLLFNRNKDFSKVLESAREATKTHPSYKREIDRSNETEFRFIFANKDDPNRELILTLLAFDVPTP
ncbi:hypothetical protein myaer102_24450 [Microcystis viridis NIES-102]|uniref:Uncharacterized protein n=1 Tax=Microcystis viridis NIES-102 TaxID=213615 RepID=A0A3G9JPQ0_MICVR|nr:hypothetical protein [Microcystis viridis]BBH39901.1 hypothetical protein myaer102_24450 [Microcystis viridis NIES-102]